MYSLSFFLMIFTISSLYSFYDTMKKDVKFYLNGNNNVEIEVFSEYFDEGATAKYCISEHCFNLNNDIISSNNIDSNKLGNYEVRYSLNYNDNIYNLKRNVKVIDKEAPNIELKGEAEITICPNTSYIEEGYIASDNYDGDVTNDVMVTTLDNQISYSVVDSSGNFSEVKRKIIYKDSSVPSITLSGNKTIYLSLGSKYVEPGYSAYDDCDGNITNKVTVSNGVNTNKVGTYYVNYEIKDSSGKTNKVTRTVIIYNLNTNNINEYIASLESYIKLRGYKVSLGYVNLNTNYTYTYNSGVVYYGASLIKTLDALYIYEKTEVNETTRELVKKAISVSDNAAHQTLVKTIGFNNLKSYGNSLGTQYTLVGGDNYGLTNVSDQIIVMKKLYNFVNTSPNGNELKQYFINDFLNYISFSGLPTVTHKYGYWNLVFHDVGIVWDNNPYIIVILSNGDYRYKKEVFEDLSRKIYDLHKVVNN